MPRYSVAKCVLPSCEIGDVGDGFGDSNNRAVTFSTVLNRPPMQQVSGPPEPESGKLRVSQTQGGAHGTTMQNIRSFAKGTMQLKLPQLKTKLQQQSQPQSQLQQQHTDEQHLHVPDMKSKVTPPMKGENQQLEENASVCLKATEVKNPTIRELSRTKDHVTVLTNST